MSMREEVEQIRRSHRSAEPKPANPAWMNTHHDLGVVLAYVDELEARIGNADIVLPDQWDGTSPIFDPRCKCEKCCAARLTHAKRKAARERA